MTFASLTELQANNDLLCRIVDSVALCESRPVPHETLMRALLDQNGHYVSDMIVELMAVAGAAGRSGIAIVVAGRCDRAILPPGAHVREAGDHDVVFYEEHDRDRPWKGKLASYDPVVWTACVAAVARWSTAWNIEPRVRDRDELEWFPWGYLHGSGSVKCDAVEFHATSFVNGHLYGTIAVAAGRLDAQVVGIIKARWLFPTEAP